MAELKNRFMSRFAGKKTKDDTEAKKAVKNVCFQKTATVYSDSIIVDAMPQQTQQPDENENYVKESGKVIQVETRENPLTRQQVVHMLKNRFGTDYDQWQSNKNRTPVDVCSEPSRSPNLSSRKRYGYAPLSPDAIHPVLPRKVDNKSGTIWLQCGEEIKQVHLPREVISLGHIRQMFEANFQDELKSYSFGVDRGMLLIRDPFTRAFKELNDVRHVLAGSHLKLLAPKKKPCRSSKHEQLSRSFTFAERRRSRSFDSEAIDALSTTGNVPLGVSRTRAGSYSFHGTTKSGYIVTPKCRVVTSTPKDAQNIRHSAEAFPKNMPTSSHAIKPDSSTNMERSTDSPSPSYGKPQIFNSSEMCSRHLETRTHSPEVTLGGIGSRLNSSGTYGRQPRSPVEEQLASLTDLLEEALRNDSVSDVTSYDNSTDLPNSPLKPPYLTSKRDKMRSSSDSGTESLISESCGYSSIESKKKPPPPRRNSSKETMKTLSPHEQPEEKQQEASTAESPRRSIIRPKVWVDTSYRVRDKSIKVTAAYLKKDFKQMKIQLEELRNQHEYNSHIFSSMISNTRKRITQAVEALIRDGQANTNIRRQKLKDEESAYQHRSDNAEKIMRRLENEIEMLREATVDYKSRASQSELDDIHSSIENFKRTITFLKSDFEMLHREARGIMAEEKHSLFEEERFFKEEPLRLGQLVNRCRHAVGNLLSLEKLALAQKEKKEPSAKGNTSPAMTGSINSPKTTINETDTMKRKGSYRRGAVVTQISHKTKVEYGGTTATTDYNQNAVAQGNAGKAKVRFNDSAHSITYHQ